GWGGSWLCMILSPPKGHIGPAYKVPWPVYALRTRTRRAAGCLLTAHAPYGAAYSQRTAPCGGRNPERLASPPGADGEGASTHRRRPGWRQWRSLAHRRAGPEAGGRC